MGLSDLYQLATKTAIEGGLLVELEQDDWAKTNNDMHILLNSPTYQGNRNMFCVDPGLVDGRVNFLCGFMVVVPK